MANVTAPINTPEVVGKVIDFESADTIYRGTIVAINAEGKAVKAADSTGLTVVGRAENDAVSGEVVSVKRGQFVYAGTSIGAAQVTKTAYAADNQTLKASGNCAVGKIRGITENGVIVEID